VFIALRDDVIPDPTEVISLEPASPLIGI